MEEEEEGRVSPGRQEEVVVVEEEEEEGCSVGNYGFVCAYVCVRGRVRVSECDQG